MKKLLFLAPILLIAAIWIHNADSLQANPRSPYPDTQPTTIITPPHLANDSFMVQIPAYGNPVFVSLTTILANDNEANLQVWINGSYAPIAYGSRYKIPSSNMSKTISIKLKYQSPSQEYFNKVNAVSHGTAGYNYASFQGSYQNFSPNTDLAVLTICDSVLCP